MKENRKCERIIFIDNLTVYTDIKAEDIIALIRDFPRTLFIFIAHEDDKGEPQGSPAVRAKQMAYAIFHVKGLAAFATVRGTGGERIDIDKDTADLVHGERKLTIDS